MNPSMSPKGVEHNKDRLPDGVEVFDPQLRLSRTHLGRKGVKLAFFFGLTFCDQLDIVWRSTPPASAAAA